MRSLSMKKISAFLLMLFFMSMCVSACTPQMNKNSSMIKSKRRFADYVEPSQKGTSAVVDLSEGPKQRYDAYLGPQNLNFDIKIVDPY